MPASLSTYPTTVDTFLTHTDNNDEKILADEMNKVQDALIAIQEALGTNLQSVRTKALIFG